MRDTGVCACDPGWSELGQPCCEKGSFSLTRNSEQSVVLGVGVFGSVPLLRVTSHIWRDSHPVSEHTGQRRLFMSIYCY